MPKRMLWANRLILSILLAKISKEENNMKNATVIFSDEFKKKTVAQELTRSQKARSIRDNLIILEETGRLQYIETRQQLATAIGINSDIHNQSDRIKNLIDKGYLSEKLLGFSNNATPKYEFHANIEKLRRPVETSERKKASSNPSKKEIRVNRTKNLLELSQNGQLKQPLTKAQLLEKLGFNPTYHKSAHNGRMQLDKFKKEGFIEFQFAAVASKTPYYNFKVNEDKCRKFLNGCDMVDTTKQAQEQAQEQITIEQPVEQPVEQPAQHETTEQIELKQIEPEQAEQFVVNIKNNNIEMSVTTTNLAVLGKMLQMMMEK